MRLSQGGWILTAFAGSSAWFLAPRVPASLHALTGTDFSAALIALASLLQLAVATWVLGISALSAFLGPSRTLRAITPRLMRRALFAGAAGALVVSPAVADPASAPGEGVAVSTHSLGGLRLPDRPLAGPAPTMEPPTVVVVEPGDTLWAIAAQSLPGDATDAEIAAACARWYAANRAVIGPDPNLIFPAQQLVPPGKDHT